MRCTRCACPTAWYWPPMTPNGMTARPSLTSMPGMIVWNGRLRGAIALGWPAMMRKLVPRFCSSTPLSGAMMPLPKDENSELMNDTALPSRSTTQR